MMNKLIIQVNDVLWGYVLIGALVACGIWFTLRTKGVQFHGGYGFINDYSIQRYFRDAKIMEIYEGTSEIQKLIVSGAILR